jgi:hypothetical protein
MVKILISLRIEIFAFAQLPVFHSSGHDTRVNILSKDKNIEVELQQEAGTVCLVMQSLIL